MNPQHNEDSLGDSLACYHPFDPEFVDLLRAGQLSTHCTISWRLHGSVGYCASVSEGLRDSLKLWAGGIAFMAIFWALLRLDLLNEHADHVRPRWFWFGIGLLALWNLGQFGWRLWQRRGSNPDDPNRR
ncbi:MAG TPA: hypothetical protein VF582_04960 [Allosphingosinicella sp.]|jgi:hypothetical protein